MNEDAGSSELNGFDSLGSKRAGTDQNWIHDAIAQHESSLLRYARHFVHDSETARDVVQDTFLQLCRQDDTEIQSRVTPWLFTVCRNRAIDVGRKENRMKLAHDSLLESQADRLDGPRHALEKSESAAGLMKQIDRLPKNQQEVLRLKFQGGLSYADIAEVNGLSRTNVGFLLHTAIAKLRQRMVLE